MALASMRRLRPVRGPALGKAPLPLTATVLSAGLHVLLAIGVVVGARAWSAHQPKTYVVNLVPAIAAVGSPQGRTAAPVPAPPPPVAPRPPAPDLPAREPVRATPPPDLPARTATPEMPARATASALPDRTTPDRAPALPRAGDKELPSVASNAPPRREPTPRREAAPASTPAPMPTAPARREVAAAPPPAPLGHATGSPQGAGAVTLNVSDFPYAWYINAMVRKITERWADRALQGRQPIAVVEIARNGRVNNVAIESTSGNPYYDQAALRAISDASPFPPLPEDFQGSVLRVHMQFNFAPDRG